MDELDALAVIVCVAGVMLFFVGYLLGHCHGRIEADEEARMTRRWP